MSRRRLALTISAALLAAAAGGLHARPSGDPSPEAVSGLPDLRIQSATVDDTTGGGNGNLVIEPGETVRLTITLHNESSQSATGVFGQLRLADPVLGVIILDKTATWADIPAHGADAAGDPPGFEIGIDGVVACGQSIRLVLDVTADGGYAASLPIDIPVAVVEEIDLALRREDATIFGRGSGDTFGSAIATGDVDGDGLPDLIVGAPLGDGPTDALAAAGEVYVVYGQGGLPIEIDLDSPIVSTTTIFGPQAGGESGTTVAAGDVDGDGFDDVIIGTPYYELAGFPGSPVGIVHVVWGSPSRPASIDLASAPGSTAMEIRGQISLYGDLGYSLATGDVNGDGFDEVLVGTNSYKAYLVVGDSRRDPYQYVPPSSSSQRMRTFTQPSDLDGPLGWPVAVADLDGDGLDDIALGAPSANPTGSRINAGRVFVVYGQPLMLPDIEFATPPSNVRVIEGPQWYASDPPSALDVVSGDVNADGYDDLLIGFGGAAGPGGLRTDAGRVYLLYGRPAPIPDVDLARPSPEIPVVHGAGSSDYAGANLAVADVDGDGFDDVLIASPGADGPADGRAEAGEVVIVPGRAAVLPDIDLRDPPPGVTRIQGAEAYDMYNGVFDALRPIDGADLDGDGMAEILIGFYRGDGPANARPDAGEVHVLNGRPFRRYARGAETFSFIDATSGTDLGLSCDDCRVTIPIGFEFEYFGERFSDLTVAANGYVSFLDQGPTLNTRCAPSRSLPNHLIAPFWDDLDPSAGGAVHSLLQGTEPNRRLTIEWADVPHFSGGNGVTFEVTLFEGTNRIVFQYQDVTFGNAHDAGATAAVGLENRAGTAGVDVSCFDPSLSAATAIGFAPFARPHTHFFDTMEAGVAGWSATGLWHQVTEPTCGDSARSPVTSWYYGQDGTCTYETGASNSGTLERAIAALPAHAALDFWQRRQEEGHPDYDNSTVAVSDDYGGTFTPVLVVEENTSQWTRVDDLDLGMYAGSDIDLRYSFDTVDGASNAWLGWQIDDVRIRGCRTFGAVGSAVSVAYASPTAVCEGESAILDGVGSYCTSCTGGLSYQWIEDGSPIAGATSPVHVVPSGHAAGTFGFALGVACTSDPACSATSDPVGVTIVPPPPVVGPTLDVTAAPPGPSPTHLVFTWGDVAGADEYVVAQDTVAAGAFAGIAGTAPSGSPGLTIPVPPGSLVYYLVAGSNAVCGAGPLR